MLEITMMILGASVLVLLVFFIQGPTVWDRLISLNLMTLKLAMLMIVYAVLTNSNIMLDIAMTYSIIGFLTASMLSRFILKGGRLK